MTDPEDFTDEEEEFYELGSSGCFIVTMVVFGLTVCGIVVVALRIIQGLVSWLM